MSLRKIVGRDPVGPGRTIPAPENISIYDGRRFEATVVFLDICKFSERAAWTEGEQETLLRVLSLFFTEMIRVIEDNGGFVEKNTGDGLMAYFVRQSEDAVSVQQRALVTALTMFSAAERLINPILKSANIAELEFRICLDHGPITVAKVGAARGFNGIVAIGTTANIASKMLAIAGPNNLLVGSKVLGGLPVEWVRQFVQLKTAKTGWYYSDTGAPYEFWEYTGRWKDPTE